MPRPTGSIASAQLALACQNTGVKLDVGDRVDVDLPTAQAAGVRCAIVSFPVGSAYPGGDKAPSVDRRHPSHASFYEASRCQAPRVLSPSDKLPPERAPHEPRTCGGGAAIYVYVPCTRTTYRVVPLEASRAAGHQSVHARPARGESLTLSAWPPRARSHAPHTARGDGQFPGERHNADALTPAPGRAKARQEPLCQRTRRLPAHPTPRQLQADPPQLRAAGFTDLLIPHALVTAIAR